MNIISVEIEQRIKNCLINPLINREYDFALRNISKIIDELYTNIPEHKRISYGRVHTIKVLSEYLFHSLQKIDVPLSRIASYAFETGNDYKSKGVALGILTYIGLSDYQSVLPYFESAASDENWDVREMSQMFFKKLIQKHPDEMKNYLLKLTISDDSKIRRFVAETLRPVQENQWFYKNPDYPLSILKNLFQEKVAYPRTAVGNNLSDLARRLPDLVYELVNKLVNSWDKNSHWIAYRACRNLVKKDPLKVMDLLGIDEYKYKNRVYKRSDY